MVLETRGCSPALRLQAIQKTARLFCRDTHGWQEELWPFSLVNEQDEYTLVWEYDAEILRILNVWKLTEAAVTAGTRGDPMSEDLYQLNLDTTKESRTILKFTDEDRADVEKGLIVSVAFLPHLDATGISCAFLDRWAEGIIAGAMATLLKMPAEK